MNINQDNLYLIGNDHDVCQDYSLSQNKDNINFVIVCDGCSSSKNTEVGSKILAEYAKTRIHMLLKSDIITDEYLYKFFGIDVIIHAEKITNTLQLNNSCLDSTLIVAIYIDGFIKIFVYGDGVILTKTKYGEIKFTEIKFESGAPFYLSYLLNKNRLELYKEQFKQPLKIITEKEEKVVNFDHPLTFNFPVDELESILISSDGILTFYDDQTKEKISNFEIFSEVLNFKNFNGQFLNRRIKRIMRDYKKLNIKHFDDLSLAAFSFKE